jgi:hypothetical protein
MISKNTQNYANKNPLKPPKTSEGVVLRERKRLPKN